MSHHSFWTGIYAAITVILFMFLMLSTLPGGMFNLNELDNQMLQQQEQPLFESLPKEYYNDYIKVNQTQSKTVTYIYHLSPTQTMNNISINIPEVQIYTWSNSFKTYIRNLSASLENDSQYSTTISHNNNSTTFSGIWGTYVITAENVSWLFPVKHEDYIRNNTSWNVWANYTGSIIISSTTFNVTYTLDLRNTSNPEQFNNTIFVIPIKEQTITYDYTIVKTESNIDWVTVAFIIGVSIGVTFLVVGMWYDNRRTMQRLERSRARMGRIVSTVRNNGSSFGDYVRFATTSKEDALLKVSEFRNQGYFTKVINRSDGQCDFWISNWRRDEIDSRGIPRWSRRNH